MSERDYRLYLTDILDAGQAIQSYVATLDFESFRKDRMCYTAVIREFEVIGEAVGRLPEELKAKYPEVPSQQAPTDHHIKEMREDAQFATHR